MLGSGSVASPVGTPGLAAWDSTQTWHWSQVCRISPTGAQGVALALLHVLHTGDGNWSHLGQPSVGATRPGASAGPGGSRLHPD